MWLTRKCWPRGSDLLSCIRLQKYLPNVWQVLLPMTSFGIWISQMRQAHSQSLLWVTVLLEFCRCLLRVLRMHPAASPEHVLWQVHCLVSYNFLPFLFLDCSDAISWGASPGIPKYYCKGHRQAETSKRSAGWCTDRKLHKRCASCNTRGVFNSFHPPQILL